VSSSSFGRNNYSGGSISPPTISSSFLELPSPLRRSETPTWIEPRSVERSQSPPEPKKSAGSSFFRFKSILMKRFEQYSEIKAKICFCYIWMNKTTYYLSLSNLFYLGKMIYFFTSFLVSGLWDHWAGCQATGRPKIWTRSRTRRRRRQTFNRIVPRIRSTSNGITEEVRV
jgi:hypothetical protein